MNKNKLIMPSIKKPNNWLINSLLAVTLSLVCSTASVLATEVGTTAGEFSVNNNGAATYTIPIQVPPGVNGLEPELALTYNSQRGNGLVGMGWAISGLSSITRCKANIATDGYRAGIELDVERFCMDGQRLTPSDTQSSSTYREFRTEIESFSRIRAHGTVINGTISEPDYFEVWTKNGLQKRYGYNARETDNGSEFESLTWSISQTQDRTGNIISYSYVNSDGEHYPDTISYEGSGGNTEKRWVKFNYESRRDISTKYINGIEINNAARVTSISTYYNNTGNYVRRYNLQYMTDLENTGSKRSRLEFIEECGSDKKCYKNSISAQWQNASSDSDNLEASETVALAAITDKVRESGQWNQILDINGDGFTDLFIITDPDSLDVDVQLGTGDGRFSQKYKSEDVFTHHENGFNQWNELVDINGDGFIDIFRAAPSGSVTLYFGSINESGHFVFETTGISTGLVRTDFPAKENDGDPDKGLRYYNQIIDMNGDGLMDIFSASGAAFDIQHGQITNNVFSFKSASTPAIAGATSLLADYDDSAKEGFRASNLLADSNADGLVDVIRQNEGQIIQLALQNSSGLFEAMAASSGVLANSEHAGTEYGQYLTFLNQFIDVNGDGILDIISAGQTDSKEFRYGDKGVFFEKRKVPESCERIGNWSLEEICENPFDAQYFADKLVFEAEPVIWLGDGNGGFNKVAGEIGAALEMGDLELVPEQTKGWYGSVSCEKVAYTDIGAGGTYWGGDGLAGQEGSKRIIVNVKYYVGCRPKLYQANAGKGISQWNSFADMDGDGFVDIIRIDPGSGDTKVSYGKGNGTFEVSDSVIATLKSKSSHAGLANGFLAWNRFVDINGDGLTDIFKVDTEASSANATSLTGTPLISKRKKPGLIKKISNGLNLETTINYRPLTDSAVYTPNRAVSNYPERNVTAAMYVVSAYDVSATGLNPQNYTYTYHAAKADIQRGWQGFSQITRNDISRNISTETQFKQTYPCTGLTSAITTRVLDGKKLSQTEIAWNCPQTGAVRTVNQASKTESVYDLASAEKTLTQKTTTSYHGAAGDIPYDAHGNPQSVVVTSFSGSATTPEHSLTTNYVSTYNEESDYAGELIAQNVTTTHQQVNNTTETKTVDKTYHSSAGKEGLLKTESIQTGQDLQRVNSYDYDQYGHINIHKRSGWDGTYDASAVATGANSDRETSYTYTPTTDGWSRTIQEGSLRKAITHEGKHGQPSQETDAAGINTYFGYDGFGRQLSESRYSQTDGVTTSTQYSTCASTACKSGGQLEVTITKAGTGTIKSQYDALGREIRTVTKNYNNDDVHQDTAYNAKGQIESVTLPASDDNTRYTYDDAGRLEKMIQPDGVVITNRYEGLKTTLTSTGVVDGANTKTGTKTYTKDTLGNIISIKLGSDETTYSYNPFNQLSSINAAGTTKDIVMSYDGLGNMIAEDDPNISQPWQYRHNAFGEVVWQQDPDGQITTYQYDAQGRMTQRIESALTGSSIKTVWVYKTDEPALLDYVERKQGSTRLSIDRYGYDSRKRPETVTTRVDTTDYEVKTSYDNHDRLETLSYPGGLKIKHSYHSNGLLKSISEEGGTKQTYWNATEYNVRNQLKSEAYGNALTGSRSYNPQTGRLTTISTAATNAIQSHSYDYYSSGNLKSHDNGLTGINKSYGYDGLHRLKTVKQGSDVTSYGYAINGNLESRTYRGAKTGADNYSYPADGSHGVTNVSLAAASPAGSATPVTGTNSYSAEDLENTIQYILGQGSQYKDCTGDNVINVLDITCMNNSRAGTTTTATNTTENTDQYQYNSSGNLTSRSGAKPLNISYTGFNKAKTLTTGGNTTSYTYGTDHQRLTKTINGKKSTYIGKLYEKTESSQGTEHRYYISALGRLVTQINQKGDDASIREINYIHTDLPGSIDVITDKDGNAIESHSFDAWGQAQDLQSFNKTSRGYTGHEMDLESGLINMNARLYDPSIGRFMMADRIIPDYYDPQSFNRYSYVLNNPFRYTDPSGYFSEELADLMGYELIGTTELGSVYGSTVDSSIIVDWSDSYQDVYYSGLGVGVGVGEEVNYTNDFDFSPGQIPPGAIADFATAEALGVSTGELRSTANTVNNYVEERPWIGDAALLGAAIIGPNKLGSGKAFYNSMEERFFEDASKSIKTPPVQQVNPRNLIPTQTRNEMSGSLVKRLMKDMKQNGFDQAKPVDVVRNPRGRLEIQDGHHRTEAARKAGLDKIPVRVWGE